MTQPTEPGGAAVIVNHVNRIEVRAPSPDPSVPRSGWLLGFATYHSRKGWWVYPRGKDAYPVADEAAARTELHRIAAELVDPSPAAAAAEEPVRPDGAWTVERHADGELYVRYLTEPEEPASRAWTVEPTPAEQSPDAYIHREPKGGAS